MLIAQVVDQLVYEQGVQAVTIREVASRVGYSTTVVSHYFSSKLEMLVFTHQLARRKAEALIDDAIRDDRPLVETLEHLLPLTEERWRDWHTWFAFWGMTPAEPDVTREWEEGINNAHLLFERLIGSAQASGHFPSNIDGAFAATQLQIFVNGIASLVAQERSAWPADRQKAMLRTLLQSSFALN
ncbi:TetR family transcriptional regulator [Novosphingobium sp. G106]|uniref:TetR/AcrR family transcriptional regulator n=1 Tax=Novosphingobium sp. G106 TaxID=2849500 RepID=UPI001C2CDCEF|nr:TetR/AcrR family transcriptional regulator [Novosphingobium sp. G106]MBV1689510.1 TetR family transcriptional regulator [Novosphingobium sp. G106]